MQGNSQHPDFYNKLKLFFDEKLSSHEISSLIFQMGEDHEEYSSKKNEKSLEFVRYLSRSGKGQNEILSAFRAEQLIDLWDNFVAEQEENVDETSFIDLVSPNDNQEMTSSSSWKIILASLSFLAAIITIGIFLNWFPPQIGAGPSETAVDFVIHVTDAQGSPLEGAMVTVREETFTPRTLASDSLGDARFSFEANVEIDIEVKANQHKTFKVNSVKVLPESEIYNVFLEAQQ